MIDRRSGLRMLMLGIALLIFAGMAYVLREDAFPALFIGLGGGGVALFSAGIGILRRKGQYPRPDQQKSQA